MATKTLSLADISRFLDEQQKKVNDIDKANMVNIGLACKNNTPNDITVKHVIDHIFSNIRHHQQDGIILCRGLINTLRMVAYRLWTGKSTIGDTRQ